MTRHASGRPCLSNFSQTLVQDFGAISVSYHYMRDPFQQGEIELEYKYTKKMVAGILMTLLGTTAFERFVGLLGLTSVDTAT